MEILEVDISGNTNNYQNNNWHNQIFNVHIPIVNGFVGFAVIFIIEKIPRHFVKF